MEIIGDKEFYINTRNALRLIRDTLPEEYDMVLSYIARIQKNNTSFLYPYADVDYFVSKKISNSSVYLYASCVLREAFHSFLVFSHIRDKNNADFGCYDGRRAMIQSYKFQLKMLNKMNAPKEVVDFAVNEFDKYINYDKKEIKIIGNKSFVEMVKKALNLLKEKDYMSYRVVIQNLGKIVYFPNSSNTYFDRFQDVPSCFINNSDFNSSIYNICGALVHEACHNKIYRENIFNAENHESGCSGYSAEMYCLTRQVECLKKIGAHEKLIQRYIYYYDVEWWKDVNKVGCLKKH